MNGRMSECMQAFLHARRYTSILPCMQEGLDGSVYYKKASEMTYFSAFRNMRAKDDTKTKRVKHQEICISLLELTSR